VSYSEFMEMSVFNPREQEWFIGKLTSLNKASLDIVMYEFIFLLGTHSVQWVIHVLTSLQTGSFTFQHLSLQ
jgi:hypothetical protein